MSLQTGNSRQSLLLTYISLFVLSISYSLLPAIFLVYPDILASHALPAFFSLVQSLLTPSIPPYPFITFLFCIIFSILLPLPYLRSCFTLFLPPSLHISLFFYHVLPLFPLFNSPFHPSHLLTRTLASYLCDVAVPRLPRVAEQWLDLFLVTYRCDLEACHCSSLFKAGAAVTGTPLAPFAGLVSGVWG